MIYNVEHFLDIEIIKVYIMLFSKREHPIVDIPTGVHS